MCVGHMKMVVLDLLQMYLNHDSMTLIKRGWSTIWIYVVGFPEYYHLWKDSIKWLDLSKIRTLQKILLVQLMKLHFIYMNQAQNLNPCFMRMKWEIAFCMLKWPTRCLWVDHNSITISASSLMPQIQLVIVEKEVDIMSLSPSLYLSVFLPLYLPPPPSIYIQCNELWE